MLLDDEVVPRYAVRRLTDNVEFGAERRAQAGSSQRVIFDDYDARPDPHDPRSTGSAIVKMLPCGSRGTYVTVPPYFCAMRRTIYKPSPLPAPAVRSFEPKRSKS